MGGLFVGAQEQQIEIGIGRQGSAPIASYGDHRQALPLGGVARAEDMDRGEVIQGADHLVGDAGQQPGGLDAAGAVLQPLLGDHPAAEKGRLENLQCLSTLLGHVPHGAEGGGGKLGA